MPRTQRRLGWIATGKITHQPEQHAAQIAATCERGDQEHDDGGQKGSGNDAGQQQGVAVDLTITAAEKIDGRDGGGGTRGMRRPE